jgi:DNA-binding NtrC family response regulator
MPVRGSGPLLPPDPDAEGAGASSEARSPKDSDMRALLFVEQAHLQRSLGRELGRLGFDVILPVTLDEARQALQTSLQAPDLVVMNLRNADGGTLDLLNVISQGEDRTPVVLIAEATDVSTARRQISMDGVVVLPSELDTFSSSVRRLCRLKVRGWSSAEHEN